MKRMIVNPDDARGNMNEMKTLAAMYDCSVDVDKRGIVPKGTAYFYDDDYGWRAYDESRRGRRVQGEQLGAEDT